MGNQSIILIHVKTHEQMTQQRELWQTEIYREKKVQEKNTHSNKRNEKKMHTNILFTLGFVEIISLPQVGVLRGVFVANHSAKTDN